MWGAGLWNRVNPYEGSWVSIDRMNSASQESSAKIYHQRSSVVCGAFGRIRKRVPPGHDFWIAIVVDSAENALSAPRAASRVCLELIDSIAAKLWGERGMGGIIRVKWTLASANARNVNLARPPSTRGRARNNSSPRRKLERTTNDIYHIY